jgi:hypothetical protein
MTKIIWFSEYTILQSPAGFYVGRWCLTADSAEYEPYARDSDYFETFEGAESYFYNNYRTEYDDVDEQQEWHDYDPDC